jgi:thiamine-monophosphate kinase
MTEKEIIARLAEIFRAGHEAPANVLTGIGDDAAVIACKGKLLAVSTDLLTEGVHFRSEWSDAYSIGRKATVANIADIYAMGIPAQYLVVAVAIPGEYLEMSSNQEPRLFQIAQAIADECRRSSVYVVGGDLSRGKSLTISITAFGEGSKRIERSGAQVGQGVFLFDLPGKSLLGLRQLEREIKVDQRSINFHNQPEVRFNDFLVAAESATAMIDISDGILADAGNIAEASKLSIEISSALLKAHPDYEDISRVASLLGVDPIDLVLNSGEEHSPLFTSSEALIPGAHRIGSTLNEGASRVFLDGSSIAGGFSHF